MKKFSWGIDPWIFVGDPAEFTHHYINLPRVVLYFDAESVMRIKFLFSIRSPYRLLAHLNLQKSDFEVNESTQCSQDADWDNDYDESDGEDNYWT